MSSQDNLFMLLKSMTKSEQRYFKLFFQNDGDTNNSIKLFDALQNVKGNYNEEEFKKKHKDSLFGKNLPFYKHYLYDLVLKSLINYNYEKTVELKILSLLQKAEILLEKKLPAQSLKALSSAKKSAVNSDLYSLMVYIIDQEKRTYNIWTMSDDVDNKIDSLNDEKKRYIEIISNLNEYWELNNEVYKFLFKANLLSEKELKKNVSVFLSSKFLKNESKALSYKAKIAMYHTLVLLHSTKSDYEKCYLYEKKLLNTYETKKPEREGDLFNYLSGYHSYLYLCMQTNRDEEFLEADKKLDKILADFRSDKKIKVSLDKIYDYTLLQKHNLNLIYYIRADDFIGGAEFIERIGKFLGEKAREVNEVNYVDTVINSAGILFGGAQFDKSLYWLNKVLLDKTLAVRDDLLIKISAMNFVIHYEMQDYELLPQLYKSLSKKAAELRIEDKLDMEVLSFLKNLSNIANKKALKDLVNDFSRFLNSNKNNSLRTKFEKEYYFLKVWMRKQ